MMRLRCSACGRVLTVKDELAGKAVSCPICKQRISIPTSAPDAAAVRAEVEDARRHPPRSRPREDGDEPRRRGSGRDEQDWEGESDYRQRSRARRTGVRGSRGSAGGIGRLLDPFLIFVVIATAACLTLIVLRSSLPPLLVFLVPGVLAFAGICWLDSLAWREGTLCGMFPWLILLRNFRDAKNPFLMHVVFGGLALLAALLLEEDRSAGRSGAPTVAGKKTKEKSKEPDLSDPGSAEPGLRARWAFDEGAGNKARDSGPHGLEATLHGCKWVPGVRGMAVQLDGTTDHIRLSPSKALSFADKAPFTVAAWVKTSSPKGVILSLRPEADRPFDMFNVVLNKGKVVVQVRQQGNASFPVEAAGTFAIHDDHWRHFAATRSADGQITLFIDGKLDASVKSKLGFQPGKLVTSNRALGVEALVLTGYKHPLLDHSRLAGSLDELYFFGDALDAVEIEKLSKR